MDKAVETIKRSWCGLTHTRGRVAFNENDRAVWVCDHCGREEVLNDTWDAIAHMEWDWRNRKVPDA